MDIQAQSYNLQASQNFTKHRYLNLGRMLYSCGGLALPRVHGGIAEGSLGRPCNFRPKPAPWY